MASSPFSTTPTSLDNLPLEIRCKLTQYLGVNDLETLRSVNASWNKICKTTLHKRGVIFYLGVVHDLVDFNDTFAKYTPTEDIAAGHFSFYLPALDTAAAKEPLDTFVETFGSLVTSLSLNLYSSDSSTKKNWYDSPRRRDTVLAHVTLLLQGVKGQVQVLHLSDYIGLKPSVFSHEPFARLHTLKIVHSFCTVASGDTVALQEASMMLLSRKVPAVRKFEFKRQGAYHGDDPSFLVNVLRNLTRVNRQVEVKLDMELPTLRDEVAAEVTDDDNGALLHELMKETVRVVDLDIMVYDSGVDRTEALRKTLSWLGAQSDWLKKLKFYGANTPLGGLKFPRLRALEELYYVQTTVESLLQYDSPDYFPSLRAVTTACTGNDFTVALPQITALTVYRGPMTGITAQKLGKYGQALFQLPPFPNVETLTCDAQFVDLASISLLQSLRRLEIRLDNAKRFAFWKRMTHGAWRWTLEQIRALPEPTEDEVRQRAEPSLSDLTHLKELTIVGYDKSTTLPAPALDALVFLSKTKRLQRLEKLEIKLELGSGCGVPCVYLDELRSYHKSVFVTQE